MSTTPRCGAKTRGGGTCKQAQGARTDHPGDGRCWLHGGDTPIKHGFDSTVHAARLKDRIARHLGNPDPTNLLPELAQLRAFAEELMERWELIYGVDGALLAWHESYQKGGQEPKPRQLPDFSAVTTVVDRVGAMVDRIQKHRADQLVSYETLNRALELFAAEVVGAMKDVGIDEDAIAAIIANTQSRWRTVRLDPKRLAP